MSRLMITVKFADGSTNDYSMPNVLDRPWGREFVEKCKASLLERLGKYGRMAGNPGEDLRRYNGNFATGNGRKPGPKPVEITREWVTNA